MNISFRDKNLERCFLDERYCQKTLGARRAKLFLQRLDDLESVENLSQVRFLPGKYHELVGDRKGQFGGVGVCVLAVDEVVSKDRKTVLWGAIKISCRFFAKKST